MKNGVNTYNLVPKKQTKATIKDNCDTSEASWEINIKRELMTACEDLCTIITNTSNTKVTKKHAEAVNNPVVHVDSDDDFLPTKSSKHSHVLSNDSDSDDKLMKSAKVGRPLILGMLPDGYTYKMVTVNLESARKWIMEYNERTKETMIYKCCKMENGL